MKIIHIGQSLGGVDTYIRLIVSGINPRRFISVVVVGQDNIKHFQDSQRKRVVSYHIPLVRNIHPIKDLFSLWQLIKIVKKEKPDLIHCHSSKGGLLGRLAAFYCSIPSCYTPNAFSYLSTPNAVIRAIFKFYEKCMRELGGTILACSESEKMRAICELKYEKERVLVWNNCVLNSGLVSSKPNQSFSSNSFDIITIGRPSYQKNTNFLIEVIHYLKSDLGDNFDINLKILGVGLHSPLKKRVEKLISRHNLSDCITLVEWSSRDETLNFLRQCDLYISTSRYEGLPYSILESMQIGIPIVATDVDGNRDAVRHGYNGYLIKEEDINGFVLALKKLIFNPKLLSKMGDNSKKRWRENFDFGKNIESLESFYYRLQKS